MRIIPSLLSYLWCLLLPALIFGGVISSANYLASYGLAVSWMLALLFGIAFTPAESG